MVSLTNQIFCGNLQLQSPDASPSMKIAALRTLSYTLKTLGEVRCDVINIFVFYFFHCESMIHSFPGREYGIQCHAKILIQLWIFSDFF